MWIVGTEQFNTPSVMIIERVDCLNFAREVMIDAKLSAPHTISYDMNCTEVGCREEISVTAYSMMGNKVRKSVCREPFRLFTAPRFNPIYVLPTDKDGAEKYDPDQDSLGK